MDIYTRKQLFTRLIAALVGVVGGMAELTWVQIINLACDPKPLDGMQIIQNCPPITRLFLRFADEWVSTVSTVLFIAGVATIAAGLLSLWRPSGSAIIFTMVALVNLVAVLVASVGDPPSSALVSAFLSVAVPLAVVGSLLKWAK